MLNIFGHDTKPTLLSDASISVNVSSKALNHRNASVKKASKKALNKNQSLYIPSEESHSNSSIKSSENSHCYHNKVKSHGDQILSQEMFNMAD